MGAVANWHDDFLSLQTDPLGIVNGYRQTQPQSIASKRALPLRWWMQALFSRLVHTQDIATLWGQAPVWWLAEPVKHCAEQHQAAGIQQSVALEQVLGDIDQAFADVLAQAMLSPQHHLCKQVANQHFSYADLHDLLQRYDQQFFAALQSLTPMLDDAMRDGWELTLAAHKLIGSRTSRHVAIQIGIALAQRDMAVYQSF